MLLVLPFLPLFAQEEATPRFVNYRSGYNPDTLALQIQLDRLNLSCNCVDGCWGARTEIALRAWQLINGKEATGIPTGASSGKSIPTADYCRGMGLVSLAKPAAKEADPTLALTPFGRTVFLEDKFFKEPFTQWLAHLRLCNEWRGADTWFYLFCESAPVFGNRAAVADMMKWISPLNAASIE